MYPEPDFVTFIVGAEEIKVAAIAETAEEKGRFNVSAVLSLIPSAAHHQKDVSCFSQASPAARKIVPTNEKAFRLDVACKNFKLKYSQRFFEQFKITLPKLLSKSPVQRRMMKDILSMKVRIMKFCAKQMETHTQKLTFQ